MGEKLSKNRWVPAVEVRQQGEALRDKVPHTDHDHAAAGPDRPSVLEFLEETNKGRLNHLVPLRVGRMLADPFAFFRGSAALMGADLAGYPVVGLDAQICGDAHAANFGLYGDSSGEIVMDINDFDETVVGPFEWDVKRLAASVVLAGRVGGVPEKGCRKAARDVVRAYREIIDELAEQTFLHSWAALTDSSVIARAKADELLDDFEQAAEKARKNDSGKVARKWTELDHDEGWRFRTDPPKLVQVTGKEERQVVTGLDSYVDTLWESSRDLILRYAVSDVAFRVVGTGSVGLRAYVVLLHGNDDDALVLQVKEARPSALAPFLPATKVRHEGERVINAAQLVQAESDPLLGWTTIDGRDYIVRQFRNLKGEIDPTALTADHLDDYGRLAGSLLARAHSRSLDPRLLAGYCGAGKDGKDLDKAIRDYAVRYADQTEADYEELAGAVRAGTVSAEFED